MARRCGEAKAREFGYDKFPVDPFDIADRSDIVVEAKPPAKKGVSGGIVFADDSVGIFYATDIRSPGYQRFTVAHELGHYYLDGHPDEILSTSPIHLSRAGFTEGALSIEIEADHFASGLLMPTHLVRANLGRSRIGLQGILELADDAICSRTAAAIRAAECSQYPIAIVVSNGKTVCYGFLSDGFKSLGPCRMLRKGDQLPSSITREFNQDEENVRERKSVCGVTTRDHWFQGPPGIEFDEEVIGLGAYGFTLTVFSSEDMPEDLDEDEDEEAELIDSYTPRFAYGR